MHLTVISRVLDMMGLFQSDGIEIFHV